MRIPKIISLPWPLLLQINALGKRGQWQQKSHFIFFSKEKQRSHLPTSCKHQLRTRIGELSKGHKFYPQKNIRLTWKKMISIFLGLPQPVSWSVHVGMSAHKHTHAALVVFFYAEASNNYSPPESLPIQLSGQKLRSCSSFNYSVHIQKSALFSRSAAKSHQLSHASPSKYVTFRVLELQWKWIMKKSRTAWLIKWKNVKTTNH